MKINAIWDQYPMIKDELGQTLDLMAQNIRADNQPVAQAILHMVGSGGKLLRPAYLLLFSMFKATDRHKMVALAAAVETLHTATLIHDDVIDSSPTRRGSISIQEQFGQSTAVYSGDYLFIVCFRLMSKYAGDFRGIERYSQHMEAILNGEMAQTSERYDVNISIDQYFKQVSGKTGQLFSLAAFLGAYESGNTIAFAKRAEQIGLKIGIAFQLLDDILDYTDTSQEIGKPIHKDIREGIYSAPLILAMAQDRTALVPLLKKQAQINDQDLLIAIKLVIKLGGIKQAKTIADNYTQEALIGLKELPDLPAKKILIEITSALLERRF